MDQIEASYVLIIYNVLPVPTILSDFESLVGWDALTLSFGYMNLDTEFSTGLYRQDFLQNGAFNIVVKELGI